LRQPEAGTAGTALSLAGVALAAPIEEFKDQWRRGPDGAPTLCANAQPIQEQPGQHLTQNHPLAVGSSQPSHAQGHPDSGESRSKGAGNSSQIANGGVKLMGKSPLNP